MATTSEKELNDNLDRIRSDIASLTESVRTLMADSAGIQSALKSKLNATAKNAATMGENLLHEAEEMGAEAFHAAQRQASMAVNTVEGQIKQNPLAAVVIALGVGFVLGLFNRK